jgi:hypothetical protein
MSNQILDQSSRSQSFSLPVSKPIRNSIRYVMTRASMRFCSESRDNRACAPRILPGITFQICCDFFGCRFSDSGAHSIEIYFLDCNTGSDSGNAKLIRMPPIEQATNCRPFTA